MYTRSVCTNRDVTTLGIRYATFDMLDRVCVWGGGGRLDQDFGLWHDGRTVFEAIERILEKCTCTMYWLFVF